MDKTLPRTKDPAPVHGETILLVEDDPGVRLVTRRMLEQLGYAVLEACNASEALELCCCPGIAIDLVMTDIVMPGMSGTRMAAEICARHAATKILFTSGYVGTGLRDPIPVEANFLQKPYLRETLAQTVREVLDGIDRQASSGAQS